MRSKLTVCSFLHLLPKYLTNPKPILLTEISIYYSCIYFKSQHTVGREKGKSKSVSFALSDASGIASPIDTNSEMGNIGDSCSDKLTDENLSNSSRHIAEKVSIILLRRCNDLYLHGYYKVSP